MSPIRKEDVFLVVRAKLRVKGQQVFLFRRIVGLSMNDHCGYSDPGRIQNWKIRIFDERIRSLRVGLQDLSCDFVHNVRFNLSVLRSPLTKSLQMDASVTSRYWRRGLC